MSIARALAVLGAGAAGFSQGQDHARRQKREDEDAAWRDKQRQRQETQWQRDDEKYKLEQANQAALRNDAKPVVAVADGVRPDTMDNADVGQPGEPSFGIRVGKTVVPDQAQADQLVGQANSMSGVMARRARLMQEQGNLEGAANAHALATQFENEGVLKLFKSLRQSVPSESDIAGTKAGFVSFEIPKAARENFDAQGQMKIPAGAVGQAYMRTLPDGSAVRDYRIVSPDGTTVHLDSGLNTEYALTQTLAQRDAADKEMAARVRAIAKEKNDTRRDDAKTEHERRRDDRALSIQESGAANSRALLGIQQAQFKLTQAAAEAEAKIPPAVKLAYASNDKELQAIHSAMLKAQADNTFDPASPNAQGMLVRMRVLQKQSTDLLAPYIGNKKAATGADDLGLFTDAPAKTPTAAKPRMAAAVKSNVPAFGTPEYEDYANRLRLQQMLERRTLPTAAPPQDYSRFNNNPRGG